MVRFGLGGAPVPAAVADRAEALGIKVTRAYGSTEHPVHHRLPHERPGRQAQLHRRPAHGRVWSCAWWTRTGPRSTPACPARSSAGDPICSSATTDPTLTAAALDADGWYHTGDIGVLDADGYLTITDRLSDLIIRGGLNLSAAKIEEHVAAMPDIAEVAVVAAPDARLGEHACAVVRTLPGADGVDLTSLHAPPGLLGVAQAAVAGGGPPGRGLRPHPLRQDQEAHPSRPDRRRSRPVSVGRLRRPVKPGWRRGPPATPSATSRRRWPWPWSPRSGWSSRRRTMARLWRRSTRVSTTSPRRKVASPVKAGFRYWAFECAISPHSPAHAAT